MGNRHGHKLNILITKRYSEKFLFCSSRQSLAAIWRIANAEMQAHCHLVFAVRHKFAAYEQKAKACCTIAVEHFSPLSPLEKSWEVRSVSAQWRAIVTVW